MNSKLLASLCSALGITLTTTAFAQQTKPNKTSSDAASSKMMMNRGEPMAGNRMMAGGYNAPASVVLNRDWCNWFDSIEVEGAFTYWMATQDGMDIGHSSSIATGGTTINLTNDTAFLYQPFQFQPGFKVGLAANMNDWTWSSRYTWVNNHTRTNKAAPLSTVAGTTGVWIAPSWLQDAHRTGDSGLFGSVNTLSSWKLRMDLVDTVAGRPFYQGPAVTVSPFWGLRGAWIRQTLHQEFTPQEGANGTELLVTSPYIGHSFSHSWAVGPRTGASVNCLFSGGFRFEGMCAANVLFTRYTKISHKEPATVANTQGLYIHQNQYNTVRPSVEAMMGIGWGAYFDNQRYHVDFSADYEFQFYWSQNMIRGMLDSTWINISPAVGDLTLQGLTATLRLDF